MSTQPSAYVYPNTHRSRMGSNNPYIENLKNSLAHNDFKVDMSVAKYAFIDLLLKGCRVDMVVLNWVENVPSRRFGALQTMLFVLYLNLLRICRVKIVWICHNNISHDKHRFAWKKMLTAALLRHSDHVITHSREADLPDNRKEVFMHHPNKIAPSEILSSRGNDVLPIDFLIWGTILPYKGVLPFLQFVSGNPAFEKFNIHIAGHCPDKSYWEELVKLKGKNSTLVNKYLEEDELKSLFRQSRFILFTYKKESVLSSGVLMDSLIAGKRIIAPDCGAFKDMAADPGFVSIYSELEEIGELYTRLYDDFQLDPLELKRFFLQNSWERMGAALRTLVFENDKPPVKISYNSTRPLKSR